MNIVRSFRQLKELSQEEFSLHYGVKQSLLSKIETGNRRLPQDVAKRIAAEGREGYSLPELLPDVYAGVPTHCSECGCPIHIEVDVEDDAKPLAA